MAFPQRQTPGEHISHLSRYNAQLAEENDTLKQENVRLREQVLKLEQTGQSLVREAQKYHYEMNDLKRALGLRNDQYQLLKNEVDKVTRQLNIMQAEREKERVRIQDIESISRNFRNRISGQGHSSAFSAPQTTPQTRWI